MAQQQGSTARGLGYRHQKQRARLLRLHLDGSPCWWCGQPMWRDKTRNFDGAELEADHEHSRDRFGIRGNHATRLLHRRCNRQRGNGDHDDRRPALTGIGDDGPERDQNEPIGLAMPWPDWPA